MADMKTPGSNNPAGGFQRRNLPYSPYMMAAAGLASIGGIWYFYYQRKADQDARHRNVRG
ncbi:hypothetical protein OROGR_014624 [Orobanche gracilis]